MYTRDKFGEMTSLENPMDGGAWWSAVHGVAKSWTQLRDYTFTFHFHALEKEMATHSSSLAWRIPWTEEPGGLQFMGLLESDTTERLHCHFSLACIGEGNGNPLQCSCLENPRDGGAWWVAVYGVAKSWTQLSDFTFTFHFHALEKEMATHSSVLAWRIPGTGEPGGLLSVGSHRVGHDRSELAAAAAAAEWRSS